MLHASAVHKRASFTTLFLLFYLSEYPAHR